MGRGRESERKGGRKGGRERGSPREIEPVERKEKRRCGEGDADRERAADVGETKGETKEKRERERRC